VFEFGYGQISFNPKPEAMDGSGLDPAHVALPAVASGFGLNKSEFIFSSADYYSGWQKPILSFVSLHVVWLAASDPGNDRYPGSEEMP